MYKIKQNILLAILFLVFSCDSGGGGSSSDNNCGTCPDLSLLIDIIPASEDYAAYVDDSCSDVLFDDQDSCVVNGGTWTYAVAGVGSAEYISCSYNDIAAQGCVNVIEADVNETNQTITIYYNINSNISGFQFELTGVTIDSIESFLPSSFSISNNDSVVIAYDGTLSGDVISARCGILMKINYSSPINNPWNSSDFISNIVFAGDTYTNNIPNSLDICSN